MSDTDHQTFVLRFANAWANRDGEAFLDLWHPEGLLHSPLYDRPIEGRKQVRLMEVVRERAPDVVWQLLDWTSRGSDVLVIEWQSTRNVGGRRFDWRGVDKFRLRDGKILEERVYTDTAPLRAARKGETLETIISF